MVIERFKRVAFIVPRKTWRGKLALPLLWLAWVIIHRKPWPYEILDLCLQAIKRGETEVDLYASASKFDIGEAREVLVRQGWWIEAKRAGDPKAGLQKHWLVLSRLRRLPA